MSATTEIRLTRSSVSAIQVVQKIVEFACDRKGLKIHEMTLELYEGQYNRRVHVGGTFGLSQPTFTFYTQFTLHKDENSNWDIRPREENILFNVSSRDARLQSVGFGIFLSKKGEFEISENEDRLGVTDTRREKLHIYLRRKIKQILK